MSEPWRGHFVPPNEGDRLVFNGTERSMKIASAETDGHLTAFISTYAAGVPHPLHNHRNAIESFYVLEGVARFYVDGHVKEAGQGSFLSVPKDVIHGFVPVVEGTRALIMFTPSAMEGFWEELATATEAGKFDQLDLVRMYESHAIEPIGPLPDEMLTKPGPP